MTKMVRIALAQLSPGLRETEANIDTVRRVVAEHPEADLIVFPELFLSGYTVTDVDELAVRLDDPELESLADVAREHSTALIVGAAERVSDGVANSAICVDERGDFVAVYRKVQVYGGDESDAFVAGDELLVAELCGVKVGLMICFDVEFPEVARALARAGAELPPTWSPSGTITRCSPRLGPWRTGCRTPTSIRSARGRRASSSSEEAQSFHRMGKCTRKRTPRE